MFIEFLLKSLRGSQQADAIVWNDRVYDHGSLLRRIELWRDRIAAAGIPPGTVAAVEGDFSPTSVAIFVALVDRGCILVPLTRSVEAKMPELLETAQAEISFSIDAGDQVQVNRLNQQADHEFYRELRQRAHPGLVLFSSGSTGKSKAAVHDFVPLLEKFKTPRKRLRTITFLLFDHIGGVNTMFYTLSNGGCIVTVADRRADAIARSIEKYRVELLPTSPTFLNMLLLSEACERYDFSSLRTITYGTEPMPESTLRRVHEAFPGVQLLQTYGLSEVGILRSKSKTSDSLLVRVGGEGFETRVVDGILQIKAQSAMLGYLNAPSPFTADGWLDTGDRVEVQGEYLRILGRESEIINVGGEKVYPTEVESVIQAMPNVADVVVYGENNPITGQMVCARVRLDGPEDRRSFVARLKACCRQQLQNFKVPVKVAVVDQSQHSQRFKKIRQPVS